MEVTSDRHQWTQIRLRLWIPGSAILVLPQTQNIAGKKLSGFERKAFTRQNYPDSQLFGSKVPTLNSGFKISGGMTKPGCFQFGSVANPEPSSVNLVLRRQFLRHLYQQLGAQCSCARIEYAAWSEPWRYEVTCRKENHAGVLAPPLMDGRERGAGW